MTKTSKRLDSEGNFRVEVKGRGLWRMTSIGKIEKFHAGEWYAANPALIHADALAAFADECDRRASA